MPVRATPVLPETAEGRVAVAAHIVNELASNRKFGLSQAGLARLSSLVSGLQDQYEVMLGKESKRSAALQAQMRAKNSDSPSMVRIC